MWRQRVRVHPLAEPHARLATLDRPFAQPESDRPYLAKVYTERALSLRARTPSKVAAQINEEARPSSPERRLMLLGGGGKPARYQYVAGHGYVAKTPEAIFTEANSRAQLRDTVEKYRLKHRPSITSSSATGFAVDDSSEWSSDEDMTVGSVPPELMKWKLKVMGKRMAHKFHSRAPTADELMDVAASMLQVQCSSLLLLYSIVNSISDIAHILVGQW